MLTIFPNIFNFQLMAANYNQYLSAIEFLEDNSEKMLKELGAENVITTCYDIDELDIDNKESSRVLWNTSIIQDIWLKRNCQLDFVQDRIKSQYGSDFKTLSLFSAYMDFSNGLTASIIRFDIGESYINLFYTTNDETYVFDENDELVVYGDSTFLEIVSQIVNPEGYGYTSAHFDFSVEFDICGMNIAYRDSKYYFKDTILDFIPEVKINFPKIKHSYDVNDADNVPASQIIFSDRNTFCSLDQYENYTDYDLKRFIKIGKFNINPNILNFIK